MTELARAGAAVLPEPANSGTAGRIAARDGNGISRTAGALIGAAVGSLSPIGALTAPAIGAAIGTKIPRAINEVKMSPLGQRYLGNQAVSREAVRTTRRAGQNAALVNALRGAQDEKYPQ
jgi:hypothetical protein